MTLRILSATDKAHLSIHSVKLTEDLYGMLADSIRRISNRLSFESSDLSSFSGNKTLFDTAEQLQEDVACHEQELLRFEKFRGLLKDLAYSFESGWFSSFSAEKENLLDMAKDVFCGCRGNVIPFSVKLPDYLSQFIPEKQEDIALCLESADLHLDNLKKMLATRVKALVSKLVERENSSSLVVSSGCVLALKKELGV